MTEATAPQIEAAHNILNDLVEAIANRHTREGQMNIDLVVMDAGIESGRIAKHIGLASKEEFLHAVAAQAPEELRQINSWSWPSDLPLDDSIFSNETLALETLEPQLLDQMEEGNVEAIHIALGLGVYAIQLATNARDYVDPLSVLGVFKTAFERGWSQIDPETTDLRLMEPKGSA